MITASPEEQLYAELRRTMSRVRWLKRACLGLLLVNLGAAIALWLIRNPQGLGL